MTPSSVDQSAEVCAVAWLWRQPPADPSAAVRAARLAGTIQAAVGFAAAALFYFWLHRPVMAGVVVGLATVNLLAALLSPLGVYRHITAGVGVLGRVIGQVVTWILMPIVYMLLFTLFGWVLRAFGKLRLSRGPDRTLPTYWRDLSTVDRSPASYERQF
jgi:hypothetical protein